MCKQMALALLNCVNAHFDVREPSPSRKVLGVGISCNDLLLNGGGDRCVHGGQ